MPKDNAKKPEHVSSELADGYRAVTPESVGPGYCPPGDAATKHAAKVRSKES